MDKGVLRVGVVADTHVPDRAPSIPEELLDGLREHQVAHILHAGDICIPGVLRELESIAPVSGVKGNRDLLFRDGLPVLRRLEFNGVRLALMHGSGTVIQYILDQFAYIYEGYKLDRYIRQLTKEAADAQVFVFGHTHRPANERHDGKLYFNPGSASFGPPEGGLPSYGLLTFFADGTVEGTIINLMRKDQD